MLGYDITDDVALLQLQERIWTDPGRASADSDRSRPASRSWRWATRSVGAEHRPSLRERSRNWTNRSRYRTRTGRRPRLSGLIETSAPLQPGDSGGPLVDTSGAVIGMDAAATSSRRGRTTNDSFAIPINTALDVARQIESGQARPASTSVSGDCSGSRRATDSPRRSRRSSRTAPRRKPGSSLATRSPRSTAMPSAR